MLPEPLHPAVVHFPIVLVVLLPLIAAAALVVIHRGANARRSWLVVVATALALALSSWAAVLTGESEEDAAERAVAESAIHEHEEAAELFLPLALVVLALTGAGLLRDRAGQAARWAATASTVALLVAGVRVGHSGGELVYVHGAANAYTAAASQPGPATTFGEEEHERGERGR